jgi:hypothetical protein
MEFYSYIYLITLIILVLIVFIIFPLVALYISIIFYNYLIKIMNLLSDEYFAYYI